VLIPLARRPVRATAARSPQNAWFAGRENPLTRRRAVRNQSEPPAPEISRRRVAVGRAAITKPQHVDYVHEITTGRGFGFPGGLSPWRTACAGLPSRCRRSRPRPGWNLERYGLRGVALIPRRKAQRQKKRPRARHSSRSRRFACPLNRIYISPPPARDDPSLVNRPACSWFSCLHDLQSVARRSRGGSSRRQRRTEEGQQHRCRNPHVARARPPFV